MLKSKKKYPSKPVLIETGDRHALAEGRNYQMGFAFTRKVKDNQYETVMPISPCKDYMNDVVYVEATKKEMAIHGFSYKPLNIFESDMAFVAFKICPKIKGGSYPNLEKDITNLNTTYKSVQKVINYVEDQLKVGSHTKIVKTNDNIFLATVPKYWIQYTYLISLWTLIIRLSQFWDGEGTEEVFLNKHAHPLDRDLWLGAKVKYEYLIKNGPQKQDLSSYKDGYDVHNCGILGFTFKTI